MPIQHRATSQAWGAQRFWALENDDSSCILELHCRVTELEEAVTNLTRKATAEESSVADPAPADSLVGRVAKAIHPSICADPNLYQHEARAAIREVAAALIDWHDSDEVVHTAWEAAKWLEWEAGH